MKNTTIKDIKEIKDLTPCYQALFRYYQSAKNKSSGKILYNVEANQSLADLNNFLEQKFKIWRKIRKKHVTNKSSSRHWYVSEESDKYCCKYEVIAQTKENVINQISLAVLSPRSAELAMKTNSELVAILRNIFKKTALSLLRKDKAEKRGIIKVTNKKKGEKSGKTTLIEAENCQLDESLIAQNGIGAHTNIQARSLLSKWKKVGEKLIDKTLLINSKKVKFSKNHNLVWQELLIEQQNGMPHVSNDPDQSLHIAKKLNADDASTSRWLKQVIEFLARHDDTEHLRTEMQDLFIRKGDYYRGDISRENGVNKHNHFKSEDNEDNEYIIDNAENNLDEKPIYDEVEQNDEIVEMQSTKKVEQ